MAGTKIGKTTEVIPDINCRPRQNPQYGNFLFLEDSNNTIEGISPTRNQNVNKGTGTKNDTLLWMLKNQIQVSLF